MSTPTSSLSQPSDDSPQPTAHTPTSSSLQGSTPTTPQDSPPPTFASAQLQGSSPPRHASAESFPPERVTAHKHTQTAHKGDLAPLPGLLSRPSWVISVGEPPGEPTRPPGGASRGEQTPAQVESPAHVSRGAETPAQIQSPRRSVSGGEQSLPQTQDPASRGEYSPAQIACPAHSNSSSTSGEIADDTSVRVCAPSLAVSEGVTVYDPQQGDQHPLSLEVFHVHNNSLFFEEGTPRTQREFSPAAKADSAPPQQAGMTSSAPATSHGALRSCVSAPNPEAARSFTTAPRAQHLTAHALPSSPNMTQECLREFASALEAFALTPRSCSDEDEDRCSVVRSAVLGSSGSPFTGSSAVGAAASGDLDDSDMFDAASLLSDGSDVSSLLSFSSAVDDSADAHELDAGQHDSGSPRHTPRAAAAAAGSFQQPLKEPTPAQPRSEHAHTHALERPSHVSGGSTPTHVHAPAYMLAHPLDGQQQALEQPLHTAAVTLDQAEPPHVRSGSGSAPQPMHVSDESAQGSPQSGSEPIQPHDQPTHTRSRQPPDAPPLPLPTHTTSSQQGNLETTTQLHPSAASQPPHTEAQNSREPVATTQHAHSTHKRKHTPWQLAPLPDDSDAALGEERVGLQRDMAGEGDGGAAVRGDPSSPPTPGGSPRGSHRDTHAPSTPPLPLRCAQCFSNHALSCVRQPYCILRQQGWQHAFGSACLSACSCMQLCHHNPHAAVASLHSVLIILHHAPSTSHPLSPELQTHDLTRARAACAGRTTRAPPCEAT